MPAITDDWTRRRLPASALAMTTAWQNEPAATVRPTRDRTTNPSRELSRPGRLVGHARA